MVKTTSYFHPDEPNADSLLGRLSICPLGAESIGFTTKYKAFARLHGTFFFFLMFIDNHIK